MNNQKITYNASSGTLAYGGSTLTSSTLGTLSSHHHWDWPTYPVYPVSTVYTNTVYRESKTDTAFKIVEKLMARKHIKELSVKEFITLVKEIAETL